MEGIVPELLQMKPQDPATLGPAPASHHSLHAKMTSASQQAISVMGTMTVAMAAMKKLEVGSHVSNF